MSNAEVDRGVAVRSARQALLTRRLPPPPTLEVIISESVVRRGISDREAMAGQLGHLADLAVWPGISIRVAPISVGLHRASMANGSFTILSFPEESEPTTVYSDGLTGALYLDKPAEIAAFEEVWAAVVADSLNEGDSLRLIQRAVKELT